MKDIELPMPFGYMGKTQVFTAAQVQRIVEADRAQRVPDGWAPAAIQGPSRTVFYGGNSNEHKNPLVVLISADDYEKCRLLASTPAQPAQQEPAPIDMVLHCPACGMQHIDDIESTLEWTGGSAPEPSHEVITWDNPPHRSHLCHCCGHIWRPADVPTNGVQAVKTKGKVDSPSPARLERKPMTDPIDQAVDAGVGSGA